ncbi:uncharacterized protein BJX67DRAFT_274029 [Aspergillus lucknowensis]|uniref:Uncharacterized protein n=1 Tax=Aspergillus lucknowensis TaxID=176173 RepID=A0ABR4LHP1_9EURO
MDCAKADQDTRTEVDTLIFDYMLCMTIHEAISEAQGHRLEGGDTTLLEGMLRTLTPPAETLTADMQIKIRVLEIINSFIRPRGTPPAEPMIVANMAKSFMLTCKSTGKGALGDYAMRAAIQICAHASLQEHGDTNGPAEGSSNQPMEAEVEQGIRKEGGIPRCISQILPLLGVSSETYQEIICRMVPDRDTFAGLTDDLVHIMELLDPPILTQLERGKLNGLSRVQTEQLKSRIGMH